MDPMFKLGEAYTRKDVQELLQVPQDRQGGDWMTGYTMYEGELYIFCNVGAAGRTGHDYPNRWDADWPGQLIWSAKGGSHIRQPMMQLIEKREFFPYIFWRSADRDPFVYAGRGSAVEVQDTSPVVVRWYFPTVIDGDVRSALHAISISHQLERSGFYIDRSLKKTWKATRRSTTVYIKRDSDAYVLVIAPHFAEVLEELLQI